MHRPTLARAFIGLSLVCGAAHATESDLPSVSITRIRSTGTWLDFAGNKPDFFARIRLRDARGNVFDCGTSSTNHDLFTALPNEVLCNPTTRAQVERPYWVLVEVYDADGPGLPEAQAPADKADINNLTTRRDAEVGPFISGTPTQRSFTLSGPDAQIDLTVTTAPLPTNFTFGPFATPEAFDPVLGESVFFSGELDDPTPLSIDVLDRRSGAVVWGLHGVPIQSMFRLGWDGRQWPGGPSLPYGQYDVSLFGPPGAPRATLPLELRPTPPLEFTGVALATPNPVNVRAIHPILSFTIAQESDVSLSIKRADSSGKCQNSDVRTIRGRFRAGASQIEWDGHDDFGQWASGGIYCMFLTGEATATGARYGTHDALLQHVEDPRPIYVDVRASPEIPSLFPGATVNVLARTFDDRGQPRPVNTLNIEAAQLDPAGATKLVSLGTCRGVSSCSFALPANITGTAALRAFGEDEKGEGHTSTGARLVDLAANPNGAEVRVSVAAIADGEMVREVPRTDAIDIAFHRTSDYPADGPGRELPSALVGRAIDSLLGYGHPSRGTSEMSRNLHATSFWFVPEPAQVEQSGSPADPMHNFCQVVHEKLSTAANVNVILHGVDCRDLAFPNRVTAKSDDPSIVWHEVHHSPFQLYDEYCCDGGYFTRNAEPNVYGNLASCRTWGSDPTGCSEIANPAAMPPVFKGIYISDPAPRDVMNDKGPENADDLRRIRAQYRACAGGRC